MELQRPDPQRLLLHDDPAGFLRWTAFGLAAAVLLVLLLGSLGTGLLALLAAGVLWLALRHAAVATEAVFDKAEGRFRVTRRRAGREIERHEGGLGEIEGVIVEAAARARRVDRRLKLRPALVVGGRPLPLSFASFESGEPPRRTALVLRDFLGLPESDLIEDSLRVAARDPDRVNPAVRLARLGQGLSHAEAAARVRQLKRELGERPRR